MPRSFAALLLLAGSLAIGQTYVTFDVPGAMSTHPNSINTQGDTAGYYADPGPGAYHGFTRTSAGTITTFDPPNSGYVFSAFISDNGSIAGDFQHTGGAITLIEVPGSSIEVVGGINSLGDVAGYYLDSSSNSHGFVRYAGGSITTFDISGNVDLVTSAINSSGEVAGYCLLHTGPYHGFTRSAAGVIQLFDIAPEVTDRSSYVTAMNEAGLITGVVGGPNITRPAYIGFVRQPGGGITRFAVPGGSSYGLRPAAINSSGAVAGYVVDPSTGSPSGFVRDPAGQVQVFLVPGASATSVSGLNDAGIITGSSDTHGYLRFP